MHFYRWPHEHMYSGIIVNPEICLRSIMEAFVRTGQAGIMNVVMSPRTVQTDCADCSRKRRTSQWGPAPSHGGGRDG